VPQFAHWSLPRPSSGVYISSASFRRQKYETVQIKFKSKKLASMHTFFSHKPVNPYRFLVVPRSMTSNDLELFKIAGFSDFFFAISGCY